MDKRVILAVAGSGKSKTIIDKLEEDSKALVLTYTELNTKQLRDRVINKFGHIPDGIKVYSYFSFLYSFCFRPLCGYELKIKGIVFLPTLPKHVQLSKKNVRKHYINSQNKIYANRIAKYLIEYDVMNEVIDRIDKYYDLICIDEIQDFASNDFNFLCELSKSSKEVLLVGDYYQHTFDTSRDGMTRKNLHESYERYCNELTKAGYTLDEKLLSKSYRCSPDVCNFIVNKLGISIGSHRNDNVEIRYIDSSDRIDSIFKDNSIIKLFYQSCSKYSGFTADWGAVKGADCYQDVCVVLNSKSNKAYHESTLHELPPQTKNKLYVACTRAKGNLYLIDEKLLKSYKI